MASVGFACCAMLVLATRVAVVQAADDAAPSDTATIRITLTIPERVRATVVTPPEPTQSGASLCLAAGRAAAFELNAVVRGGRRWRLTPVNRRDEATTRRVAPGNGPAADAAMAPACRNPLDIGYAIDASRHARDGLVTVIVSPE